MKNKRKSKSNIVLDVVEEEGGGGRGREGGREREEGGGRRGGRGGGAIVLCHVQGMLILSPLPPLSSTITPVHHSHILNSMNTT